MIEAHTIEARKSALAKLMADQLGVGGATFENMLTRAGRRLPAWARRDAAQIVEASRLAAHPKLARQLDLHALSRAEARLTRYLKSLDPKERRTTARLHLAGGIVLKLLAVAALFLMVLRWQNII